MTTELWATLIGGIVLVLTNTAAAIKLWTDMQKQKADRAETKVQRDADSAKLQEATQKNTWEVARLKEDLMVVKTHIDDHQLQLSNIVTEIAKLGVKMDTVIEGLNKLQEEK
jgi:hypothetical protein